MIGIDTGFFIRLLQGQDEAQKVWQNVIKSPKNMSLVSCISIYELQRNALKGAVDKAKGEHLLGSLPEVFTILYLTSSKQLRRAAAIAHGNGLAMADALILTSLMDGGAKVIYTTDKDMFSYQAGPKIVKL